jgi:hypothetical protein
MQLLAVHKQKPTKKFVVRKRETVEEESKKHHLESRCWCRDDLGAGEDDLCRFHQESLLLHLFRSASTRAVVAQPEACFFAPFFTILVG